MRSVTRDWAGRELTFALRTGEVLDLETARGAGIGTIYKRLASHEYHLKDVQEVLRLGLVGGEDMKPAEARRLIEARFDEVPYLVSVELAIDVLLALMAGAETDGEGGGSEGEAGAFRQSEIFAGFAKLGITPAQLRAIEYADFLNMMQGFGGAKGSAPSEEEFFAMVKAYEERAAE